MPGDLLNASSILPELLFSGQLSGTGVDTVYTVAANQAVKVVSFLVANVTNDPALGASNLASNVWIALVPPGGAADGTHRLLPYTLMQPGDEISLDSELMMHGGCSLQAQADQASAIDILITGLVIL